MAARVDWTRLTWPLSLACLAAPLGVLAGVKPELAIVAALGLAFVLVVFADLTTGVVVFTLLTFFELLPGEAGFALSFTKIAGLLLAISWLALLATRGDAAADPLRAHPLLSGFLVLFVAWAAISTSWSEQPADAVAAAYRLGLNAILFLIVFSAVRTDRDAIRVLVAFVIGATAAMAYGLLFGGIDPSPYGETARLSSVTQNANELAATLVAVLALALGLAFALRESPAGRVALLTMAAFALFGIMLTVSRSGLVALGTAAVAAILFSGRWRPRVTLVASLIAVASILYFALLAPDVARERVTRFEGGTGREDIWRVAWRMVEAQPLQGVGAGNFDNASIHYLIAPGALERDDFIVDTQKVAHNVYLGTWAEQGAIGLLLLLALIAGILACSVRAIREFQRIENVRMEILARAHLVALVGLLASLFFASDEYKKQLWLMLSLSPALLAVARAQRRPGDESE